MILRKAPRRYKPGEHKLVTKFAFKPVELREVQGFDVASFEPRPDIIGEVVWLERYVEKYVCFIDQGNIRWQFVKSERYEKAFLNKLCE